MSLKVLKTDLSLGNKGGVLVLSLVSVLLFSFLAYNHSFVPMWVEGFAEFEVDLQTMLGFKREVLDCWLHVGRISLPLAMNPYIGSAIVYLQAPAVYLWFSGISSDPYIYRYTGIVFFLADGWLIYYILRNHYDGPIPLFGAIAFLTTPLLFLGSLTEYGNFSVTLLSLILLAALFYSLYIRQGNILLLLASALMLGTTLMARIDMFIWFIIPFFLHLVFVRPAMIMARLKGVKNKWRLALLTLASFCLGAAPTILYNLRCPENNIFAFVSNVVLPKSINNTSTPVLSKLATRLEQFWSYNLLNQWPMWELGTPNYVLALFWLISLTIIIGRWIVHRQPNFLLIALLTSLPLSLLTTSQLRAEHLMTLEPVVILMIVSALAYAERIPRTRRLVHLSFFILILGNVVVSVVDWKQWQALPDTKFTYLNQSDPVLLANYLSQYHPNDRILYTNLGMKYYVDYVTVGRLKGEDIMSWTGINPFVDSVKLALMEKNRRRVFVAVSKERDGLAGSVPHTNALYAVLDQMGVPYGVTHLQNARNRYLYDIVVVEKGAESSKEGVAGNTILVTQVLDVRISPQPDGQSLVIGSIQGTGLKRGDVILIDGNSVPTAFGNETWLSFSTPTQALNGRNSFTLEVLRSQSGERSKPFVVNIR